MNNTPLKSPKPSRAPRRHDRPLPLWPRVLLLATGWVLVVVGVAGLVLPGVQGILTLFAALALLSAGSATAHRWIRGCFGRWPKGWKRVEKLRRRVRHWLHRDSHPPRP